MECHLTISSIKDSADAEPINKSVIEHRDMSKRCANCNEKTLPSSGIRFILQRNYTCSSCGSKYRNSIPHSKLFTYHIVSQIIFWSAVFLGYALDQSGQVILATILIMALFCFAIAVSPFATPEWKLSD